MGLIEEYTSRAGNTVKVHRVHGVEVASTYAPPEGLHWVSQAGAYERCYSHETDLLWGVFNPLHPDAPRYAVWARTKWNEIVRRVNG